MPLLSVHESGGSGSLISIEASMSNGLPNVIIVGHGGKSLDESRERIRSAFSAAALSFPKKRITINLSPSDVPKDGAHYDLPIALSVLGAAKMVRIPRDNVVVLGELGLDGSIKPVKGVIGKMLVAVEHGITKFILPDANAKQASLLRDVGIYTASTLKQVADVLTSEHVNYTHPTPVTSHMIPEKQSTDFTDVIGQKRAKRALEIAAAGGHNVLLNGPPGVGKSMLAKAMPGIMHDLTHEETVSVTHLHSLSGDSITRLVTSRPFRSPHHSASDTSIVGGGQRPRPGEVTLAHHGILFLDELPEFRRGTIESLRQPLEDGKVTVSRAKESVTYPSDFILIATKNPCPCGYFGSTKPCTCSAVDLQRYQKKLSGPILDRIDIHVTVDNIDHKRLLQKKTDEETSSTIKQRVVSAVKKQDARSGPKNANLSNRDIKKLVTVEPEAKELLDAAAQKLDISARVYMKILKIAQTIADLDESSSVKKQHVAEAIQYRPVQQQV